MFVRAKKSGKYHYLKEVRVRGGAGGVLDSAAPSFRSGERSGGGGVAGEVQDRRDRGVAIASPVSDHGVAGGTAGGAEGGVSWTGAAVHQGRDGGMAVRGTTRPVQYIERAVFRHHLDALEEITVRGAGKTFVLRTRTLGDDGEAIQAVGVALGPTLRLLSDNDSS